MKNNILLTIIFFPIVLFTDCSMGIPSVDFYIVPFEPVTNTECIAYIQGLQVGEDRTIIIFDTVTYKKIREIKVHVLNSDPYKYYLTPADLVKIKNKVYFIFPTTLEHTADKMGIIRLDQGVGAKIEGMQRDNEFNGWVPCNSMGIEIGVNDHILLSSSTYYNGQGCKNIIFNTATESWDGEISLNEGIEWFYRAPNGKIYGVYGLFRAGLPILAEVDLINRKVKYTSIQLQNHIMLGIVMPDTNTLFCATPNFHTSVSNNITNYSSRIDIFDPADFSKTGEFYIPGLAIDYLYSYNQYLAYEGILYFANSTIYEPTFYVYDRISSNIVASIDNMQIRFIWKNKVFLKSENVSWGELFSATVFDLDTMTIITQGIQM